LTESPSAAPRLALLCWIAAALIWFAPLGCRSLVHPDEGRYSEISREMLASGDWVTPRLDGLKYFEKPPLQYWATAASFAAFGVNEFAARLFTALCGFLSVLAAGYTARRLWGWQAGAFAAIATASMTWVMAVSHVVTLDMGVSFFLTAALCGFLLAQNQAAAESERRRWMWLVWAAMAGATLTKGLIGGVIPGAVLVLYSLICKQWSLWKRMEWLVGAPLFLLLAAPWFVIVSARNPEFAHFFFIHEHLERYLTTEHHRAGAPWYFVPILVGGLLPWTTLAPQFFRFAWRTDGAARLPNRLIVIWCAFVFAFFSLSGSKLPGYILPMFPAMGLLLGQYLALARPDVLKPHARFIAALWAIVAIAAPFVVRQLSTRHTPAEINIALGPWAVAAALVYVVFALYAVRASSRDQKMAAALAIGFSSLIALQIINGGYQLFTPIKSAKAIAAEAAPAINADTELFVIRSYDQTLPFYLGRTLTPVEFVDELELGEKSEPERYGGSIAQFKERWSAAGKAVAFTSPDTLKELQDSGLPMRVLAVHYRHAAFTKP
jgi:4-amino-4-deoxy-L-arabinose transferase-like glycosyltransferase